MALRPDKATINQMRSSNAMFDKYFEELIDDFVDMISGAFGDSGGPNQESVNIAFCGFCLGNLNACDEGSSFFQAVAENAGVVDEVGGRVH